MKNILMVISLFSVISVFFSCQYEPTEVYQLTVKNEVWPPEIQTIGLDINEDTIYLCSGKFVDFNFKCNDREIIVVLFMLDDSEDSIEYSESGSYTFSYEALTEGIHTLLVQVYTHSGTGSIADKIHAEYFIISYYWTLVVDKSYHPIVHAGSQNGFLKLSWTAYPDTDLKEYIVYNTKGAYMGKANTPEFIDSTYVGEGGYYTTYVKTTDGKLLLWVQIELANDLPGIFSTVNSENQYILYWNKSKYYNAVDTFELAQSFDEGNQYTKVMLTTSPEDTTYRIIATCIDRNIRFKLKLIPKGKNTQYHASNFHLFESCSDVNPGFRYCDSYSNISYIIQTNKDDFIYSLQCNYLIRYSAAKNYEVETLNNKSYDCSGCGFRSIRVSASGNFITAYMKCLYDIMLANTDNLSGYSSHSLKTLTGGSYYPEIPMSDIGTGIINNSNGGFYLYDFNSSTVLASYKIMQAGLSGTSISPSGDFIFLDDGLLHLVQYKDSQFVTIWDQSEDDNFIRFFEFDASTSNQFVVWDGSVFSAKKCGDLSLTYTFELKDATIVDIDYLNNKILTYGFEKFRIRILNNGALIREISVNTNMLRPYDCHLVNEAIITPIGLIYFTQ